MVAGDFNVNLLVSRGASKEYLDLLSDYQLTQYIKKPTRICALSETLIDHIYGTKCLDVSNVTQALGISDHSMQVVDFDIPMLPPSSCQHWIRSVIGIN